MATTANRLLSSLSEEASDLLLSRCTAVPLPVRASLFISAEKLKHATFITSGLASVVTPLIDGGTVEVEVLGREGFAGSFHLLGPASLPTSCFMQLAGTGLRIEMIELRRALRASDELNTRILELVQYQASSISQMAGCNRLHEAEARLARWLLMAHDRTDSDVLQITQESLAKMLGTQRTTMTAAAGILQRSCLIEFRRGELRIRDLEGLTAAACDCYRVVRKLNECLYSAEPT